MSSTIEIQVPSVGESIVEVTVGEWLKENGEFVSANEAVVSLETDKANVDVVAEKAGTLEIVAESGTTLSIGAALGKIHVGKEATKKAEKKKETPSAKENSNEKEVIQTKQTTPSLEEFSPAVRRLVAEKNIDPETISGSGKDGRITKEDLLKTKTPRAQKSQDGQVRKKMSGIRKRIAERLVYSQHTTATLTTFNEIDMHNLLELRKKYKDDFQKRYGVKLGFMGFFTKACIEALKRFPETNAFIDGDDILYNESQNIGIAIGTPKGLVVPILRDAQNLSLSAIELKIKELALKGKEAKLTIDDLSKGTFTISNGGTYGSLMSTPIINPPQSAILGMHKIEERPIALDGTVVIRPMMYVALSYDHRIIDGEGAVKFLVTVKECIEEPSRLLLEI